MSRNKVDHSYHTESVLDVAYVPDISRNTPNSVKSEALHGSGCVSASGDMVQTNSSYLFSQPLVLDLGEQHPNYFVPATSTAQTVSSCTRPFLFQEIGSEVPYTFQASTAAPSYSAIPVDTHSSGESPSVSTDNSPAPKRREYTPSICRIAPEHVSKEEYTDYRRKRERNNVAVRKCREKAKLKQRSTDEEIRKLRDENDSLHRRIDLLNRQLATVKKLLGSFGVQVPVSSAD